MVRRPRWAGRHRILSALENLSTAGPVLGLWLRWSSLLVLGERLCYDTNLRVAYKRGYQPILSGRDQTYPPTSRWSNDSNLDSNLGG